MLFAAAVAIQQQEAYSGPDLRTPSLRSDFEIEKGRKSRIVVFNFSTESARRLRNTSKRRAKNMVKVKKLCKTPSPVYHTTAKITQMIL